MTGRIYIRKNLWATGSQQRLARVTIRAVPTQPGVLEIGDIGLLCHARLVLTGANGYRLHEELVIAGGRPASVKSTAPVFTPDASACAARVG